jgi:hypothetical protein
MSGEYNTRGEMRSTLNILIGKPERIDNVGDIRVDV